MRLPFKERASAIVERVFLVRGLRTRIANGACSRLVKRWGNGSVCQRPAAKRLVFATVSMFSKIGARVTNRTPREVKKRLLIFFLYDPEGLCDASTLHTLKELRPNFNRVVAVSNGMLDGNSHGQVSELVDELLERDNEGLDVGAYFEALEHIGWDCLGDYDELLLANHTFFGPVDSFAPLFSRMDAEDVDFWGMTDHLEMPADRRTGQKAFARHLQSYWLAIRRQILVDPSFEEFWRTLPKVGTYEDSISSFETVFTKHLSDLGYRWKAAFPASDYGVKNPAMAAPIALLEDGCPVFKKRLYFHDAAWLLEQGVYSGAVTKVAEQMGYPRRLVLEGSCRRTTSRELSFGMDASFCVPDGVEFTRPDASLRIVDHRPWKELAEHGVDNLLQNCGVLVVNCPDVSRRSLSDGRLTATRYARASIVAPQTFVARTMAQNESLAALFPYADIYSESVSGTKWFSRTRAALAVAQALGIHGPFNTTSTVAPYRGVAAYSRNLLSLYCGRVHQAGGWEQLVEVAGSEERLLIILDLLAGDLAKEGGWFVGQVGTETELRRNNGLLQNRHSREPHVHPGYLDYPYAGRVMIPTLRNRAGIAVKAVSPEGFELLNSAQKKLSKTIHSLLKRK